LAEFFNQSRSDTVLANGGQFMDRTCTTESLQNPLLIYFKAKKKKKYREIYIYFHEYSMDAIRMRICLGKKIEFSSETKGGVFMEERNAYSYCLFKKKSEG
jgi:hypothetical protein